MTASSGAYIMADFRPLLDVESTAEHNGEVLLKESAPTEWKVCVNDHLPTPKYGPWVAVTLSSSTAIFLVVIACHEFRLLQAGFIDPLWNRLFETATLLIGLAATRYITGQVTVLWLYDICRPQASEAEAKRRSTLGKVLTGIAELRDRFVHWRATSYVLSAAVLLAALTNAITAHPTMEHRPYHMSPLPSTFSWEQCLRIFQSKAEADDYGYSWQVAGANWISAMTTIPTLEDSVCPWYSVSSILGVSATAVGYAYNMAGVPVGRLAIGVPARLGSSTGPFEPIFGTEQAARTPLPSWADNSTGFIYGASACLPVLVENPVKCYSLGPVSPQARNSSFSFGEKVCGNPWVVNMSVPLAEVPGGYASWRACNKTGPAVGQATYVLGAIGNNAAAYAELMGEKAISANGVQSYSLACDVNVQPNIGFRNVTYAAETVRATGNTIFTVTGSQTVCRPHESSGGGDFNQSLILNNDSLAIGASGIQALIMENYSNGGYPSLLSQIYTQQQKNQEPFNFNSSKTSLEDSLGLSIGAALGVYWGATLPNMIPNGYSTSVTFGYTRLGSGGYWPVIFAVPFIGMTMTALISLQKKYELNRIASGQAPRPVKFRKSWWKVWRLVR